VTRLRRSPRRRVLAGLGAIAAVVVAVAIILASSLTGSTKAAGRPAKAQGSATVQRRDLIATDTESGTLSYADPQTVFNRLSGTVTWLPPVGRVIKPGQTLYKVDGAPVVLFNGTLPAYRDLSEADTDGPDIEQLKRNLRSLGFDPQHQMTIDQTFDAATAAAVERWQESVGEPQTGSITLGQIVFLPGVQRVTTVDAELGSTGGSSGAASSATNTSLTVTPHAEFVSLSKPAKPTTSTPSCRGSSGKPTEPKPSAKQPSKCKQSSTGPAGSSSPSSKQQLAALLALLKAETLALKKAKGGSSSGGGSSSATAGRGGGGGGGAAGGGTASAAAAGSSSGGSGSGSGGAGANAQPILQTTSTQLVVTVDLDATMQSEAVVHEPVTIELPDGSTVGGKITQVSPVAQSSSSSSSGSGGSGSGGGGGGSSTPSATVPVTIALTGHRHLTGLDQAAVSVNFEQQKATNVLSVPVSALLATAGGGYAVQEAQPPGKLLPVTPGLFAAGYVQISGSGIFPGLQVTDSQG
jgi:hypothetical protein